MRSIRRRTGTAHQRAFALLLVLAALVSFAAGSRVAHVHEDASPGFYDARHVLETLAGTPGDAPLCPVPAIARIVAAAGPVAAVPAPRVARADRSVAGPRAPPAA